MILQIEGLTVRRGPHRVLDEVSWTLRDGEAWAIVGPNGAGKSSLASALRGELPVSKGKVRLQLQRSRGRGRGHGHEPWEEVQHVAFDTQLDLLGKTSGYHQSRWHGGEDAEVLAAGELLTGAAERRAARALGLGRLLRRKLTELSSGERRKLQLALALAKGPGLLILDNPFTGLDAASRGGLFESIRRLMRAGQRLVVVASRQDELPPGITHVLCLRKGKAIAAGPRDEVLRRRDVQQALRVLRASRKRSARAPRLPAGRKRGKARPLPVIQLADVTVRYEGKPILRGVSWTVRRGERWAILGPNGAGKTTLLSLVLADNPQAYSNDVALFGERRGEGMSIWEVKRRIGCVSPELHLFQHGQLSALDAVCSGFHDSIGLYRRCSRAQKSIGAAWLRRMGLGWAEARPFRSLSEGEQRLVLLARALVKRPELLVLDEPCHGLDEASRSRFLHLLAQATRKPSITLLHVTHEPDELLPTTTHRLVLRRGRVASQGPVETGKG